MPALLLAFALRNWRLIVVAIGVLVIIGGLRVAYLSVRHEGYVEGFGVAQQQCEADKAKQEAANQNAINEAAKKLTDLQKNIDLKDIQLDDYLKGIDLAANQIDVTDKATGQPDACLDVNSVRRLNAVS